MSMPSFLPLSRALLTEWVADERMVYGTKIYVTLCIRHSRWPRHTLRKPKYFPAISTCKATTFADCGMLHHKRTARTNVPFVNIGAFWCLSVQHRTSFLVIELLSPTSRLVHGFAMYQSTRCKSHPYEGGFYSEFFVPRSSNPLF